jgi:3-deoxy-D-manno-octulosonic-acid transferase
MEPAGLGLPVVIGPRYGDFAAAVDTLAADGAVRVVDRDGLAGVLAGLMGDPASRAGMGAKARACVLRHQGASARHAEMLLGHVAGRSRH